MDVHGGSVCPEAVLASIAWYPDRISEDRRGLVEAHAAGCRACRDELAFVQGEAEPELALPDPDAVYARVLARIEAGEQHARETARSGAAHAPRLRGPGLPRRAALAAGIALAFAAGAIGLVSGRLIERASLPDYETAGGAAGETAAALASGPVLEVVFRSDATADSIHAALRAIGGQVESGPSQLGVYRVRLAAAADAAAAARVLRGGAGGDGRGVASFAEPAIR